MEYDMEPPRSTPPNRRQSLSPPGSSMIIVSDEVAPQSHAINATRRCESDHDGGENNATQRETSIVPSHSGSGLFGASRDFDIYGGSIMSAGGNITIFNGPLQSDIIELSSGTPRADEIAQQRTISHVPAQASSQRSSEVYHRNLITKKRGSPLWIPEPPYSLPIAYQRKGVSIGDVGVLSASGTFDFFFNICYSSDDPINSDGVPEGFKPLIPSLPTKGVRRVQEYDAGSYVTSESVNISRRHYSDSQVVDLVFQSSAEEGAILTMPKGARSEDVIGTRRLRGYIAENIESWYRYIIQDCDCDVDNGDVLLVTGCDKTDSWGVATFVKSSESVQLRFHPVGTNHTYKWEYSGSFDARTGPNERTMRGIRMSDDPEHSGVAQDPIENQCVFVRTLTGTLRDDVWQKMRKSLYLEVGLIPDESGEQDNANPQTRDKSSQVGGHPFETDTPPRPTKRFRHDLSILSNVSTDMIAHPSKLLNQFLWDIAAIHYPNSRIVITEDNDWISVLRDDDRGIPSSDIIYQRIMEQDALMTGFTFDRFLPWSFSAGDDSYRASRLGEPLSLSILTERDNQGGSTRNDNDATLLRKIKVEA